MLTLKKIGVIVLLWRLILTVVVIWTITALPFQPTFPYANELLSKYGSRLVTTWAHFDGVHYLTLIEKGYHGTGLIQAFFPLYPLLVKLASFSVLNPIVVGIIISTGSFITGLWLLRKLVLLDETETVFKRVVWLILLAPTSFYFTSLYTEGVFFLLTVSIFYCARTKRWWLAGLLGALATSTRLVGIFLIPALLYEYWEQNKKVTTRAASTLLPGLGLGAFMVYLQREFKDALLFFHAQADFGTARETKRIILLYQVFYRYIKMFLTVPITDRLFYIVTQEFLAGLLGLAISIVGWFTIRKSYVIFLLLAYITPTLTGTFTSLLRYLLPLFPMYIVVAKLLPRWLYVLTLILSSIMLIINLILFTQGLWVA